MIKQEGRCEKECREARLGYKPVPTLAHGRTPTRPRSNFFFLLSTHHINMSLNFYEDRTWKLAGDAKVTKDAETQTIKLVSGPKTDWWRTPKGSEPESDVDRRSGPTYSTPVKGHKWSAGVWMRVDLKERCVV